MCTKKYNTDIDNWIEIISEEQWLILKEKYQINIEKRPSWLIIKKDGNINYME